MVELNDKVIQLLQTQRNCPGKETVSLKSARGFKLDIGFKVSGSQIKVSLSSLAIRGPKILLVFDGPEIHLEEAKFAVGGNPLSNKQLQLALGLIEELASSS